jgi:hypothetical protein
MCCPEKNPWAQCNKNLCKQYSNPFAYTKPASKPNKKPIREGGANSTETSTSVKPDSNAAIRFFLLILNPWNLDSARMTLSEDIALTT